MQRITERQLAAIEGRNDIEVFLDERTRRIPLGRRTDCETVASTIVWLALDAPDYITAERLNASGGLDKDSGQSPYPASQTPLLGECLAASCVILVRCAIAAAPARP